MSWCTFTDLNGSGDQAVYAAVVSNQPRESKAKKPYRLLNLDDGVTTIRWHIWNNLSFYADSELFVPGTLLKLERGMTVGSYGLETAPFFKVTVISKADVDSQCPLAAKFLKLANEAEDSWVYINSAVAAIQDSCLREACMSFLETHGDSFRVAAAGRSNHHAYRGGLINHTCSMMKAALCLHSHYMYQFPHMSSDLLVAGVLFHDSGKTIETNFEDDTSETVATTFVGEACGHIAMGVLLAKEALDHAATKVTVDATFKASSVLLTHLIVSHHGCAEWGSPVDPKCPEAFILHLVDMIDSRLDMWASSASVNERKAPGVAEGKRPLSHAVILPHEIMEAARRQKAD